MSWLKLGEEFTKECAQADLSDAAFRTHVEGLAYAMDRENDGRFADKDVRRFAETDDYARAVQELVDAGFWMRHSTGELQVVHHIEEQPSAAYLRDQRQNAAARQRRKRELDALTAQGHSKEEAERILQGRGVPAPKSGSKGTTSQGESRRDVTRDVTRDETRDPERSGTDRNGADRNRTALDAGSLAKPTNCIHPDCGKPLTPGQIVGRGTCDVHWNYKPARVA